MVSVLGDIHTMAGRIKYAEGMMHGAGDRKGTLALDIPDVVSAQKPVARI